MNKPDSLESSQSWQEEIKAVENESRLAFVARDIVRLRQFFSDDFVVNSPINRIHNKQQILDLLGKGIIAHVALEQNIEFLQRQQDIVVAMGSEVVSDMIESAVVVRRRRFTNMWRRENEAWRLFVRHANIVAND